MTKIIGLDLLGGIALLLWGLHMVHSGIMRAFGADLRRVLGTALRNRFLAFLAGLGITALLQSSTATALMASSFAASGMLALVPALALMLGANVGTTLVVQVMSFNVTVAAPVLLAIGVLAFNNSRRTRVRDLGRVAIGLGLLLLSLQILLETLAPAELAPEVRTLLHTITGYATLNVILGAVLAWTAHSSVAIVILTVSLSYSGFVTPEAALALVLGANLGSAINPLFEAGSSENPASRRLPVGNSCGLRARAAISPRDRASDYHRRSEPHSVRCGLPLSLQHHACDIVHWPAWRNCVVAPSLAMPSRRRPPGSATTSRPAGACSR